MRTLPHTEPLTQKQILNIQEWIQELRSGQYNQGHLSLKFLDKKSGLKHCCLGVLCDKAGVKSDKLDRPYFNFSFYFHFASSANACVPDPAWMIKHVGFDFTKKVCRFDDGQSATLIQLNDELDFSFEQIASVIQACFIDRVKITVRKESDED